MQQQNYFNMETSIVRMRPVRCNLCGNYEFIKISGINNIASYKCNMCRLGQVESVRKLTHLRTKRNMQVDKHHRSSHDKKM